MATPNATQIFGLYGSIAWTTAAMTAANTDRTGATGTKYPFYRKGSATEWTPPAAGSIVYAVTFRPLGGNANEAAGRIFLTNGSGDTTAGNNILLHEVTLPPTPDTPAKGAPGVAAALNLVIPAGCKLFVTLGAAPGTAGWKAWLSGMDYE